MIKLLKYYAKKRLYIVGFLSIMLMLMSIILFRDGFIDGEGPRAHPTNNPINAIGAFSIVLSVIVPIFEFSFKMRKVDVDEYYKFPITRKKLYLTKYIVGLLEVIIPITVFWLFMLMRILLSNYIFILKFYFVYLIVLWILIFLMYSIIAFAYLKCNTIYDGLICVFLVSLMSFALIGVIEDFLKNFNIDLFSFTWGQTKAKDFIIFYPIIFVSEKFTNLVSYFEGIEFRDSQIVSLVVYLILGITSFVLLVVLSNNEKAEDSMDISSSWFSYKTLIPIYIVYLTTSIDNEFVFVILIAIISYIGYAVYRRSFKIKFKDILTMAGCILLGFTMSNLHLLITT